MRWTSSPWASSFLLKILTCALPPLPSPLLLFPLHKFRPGTSFDCCLHQVRPPSTPGSCPPTSARTCWSACLQRQRQWLTQLPAGPALPGGAQSRGAGLTMCGAVASLAEFGDHWRRLGAHSISEQGCSKFDKILRCSKFV